MGMKTLTLMVLPCMASAAEIPSGTHVLLRLVNSINTRTAREGDQVYMQTASPIAVGGKILVPPGTYVQGSVSHAKQSGRVKGRAELGIRLETLTLDGKVLKISPRLSSVDSQETGQRVEEKENLIKQGSDTGRDARQVTILAGSGAGIGGIADRSWKGAGIGAGVGGAVGLASVLMTRGREVEMRQGSTLDVVFDRAITVE